MSSIIVNGVTTATNLPVDSDLKTFLESHPATVEWFQMDPEHCDLNGANVQRIRSIGSGKSVFSPDVGVPTLAPFDSYAGFTALALPGNSTQRFAGPVIPALAGSFTIIVVAARSGGITAPGKWINWGDSSGSETRLQYASNGSIQAFHRERGITIAAPLAPDDKPRMNLMSFDGKNLRGRSNSGVIATSADVTGALPATATTFIGGVGANYPRGSMSDVVILNTDLLAAANADLYALWRELFSDVYAINLEL